jgi:guanylate kinase
VTAPKSEYPCRDATPSQDFDIFHKSPPSLLFVLSGPSGVGKDTVITALKQQNIPLHFTVTLTTRIKRPDEIEGINYHFVSLSQFEELQHRGALLEWAIVHGNCYGTPLDQVREALLGGKDVLLKIDVQGAAKVKEQVPDAVFIFLAPPSLEALTPRLVNRGTESPQERTRRLRDAVEEVRQWAAYDYVVVNQEGRVDEAVERIKSIIVAEKCRAHPRHIAL